MDFNNYRFQSDFNEFEYANYQLNQSTQLISASMAWLLSPNDGDEDEYTQNDDKPRMDTLNYWVLRLKPLLQSKNRVIIAISNRTGNDFKTTRFCGSSAVIEFNDGQAVLHGALGWNEERVLIRKII